MKRAVTAILLCLAVAGCQSQRPEGKYVTFLRDAMAESRRMKVQDEEGHARSEQAVGAVRAWVGQGAEED